MNKLLIAVALLVATGCTRQVQSVAVENKRAETKGLERRTESFEAPDKYGVVCYQDLYTSSNLSCVKVH